MARLGFLFSTFFLPPNTAITRTEMELTSAELYFLLLMTTYTLSYAAAANSK